jgi:hypothetical protein
MQWFYDFYVTDRTFAGIAGFHLDDMRSFGRSGPANTMPTGDDLCNGDQGVKVWQLLTN